MQLKTFTLSLSLLCSLPIMAFDPPTMGWSSWNTYNVHISESIIRSQADALKAKGLDKVGYTYVNIDDGFFGGRDSEGNLIIHPTRFPNGLKPVADYIHSLGLKAGIYSDAGHNTCGHFWAGDALGVGVGLYEHEEQDADMYFNDMGFDFIKIDYCGAIANNNSEGLYLDEQEQYTKIRKAIDAVGRSDVRVNVCRWAFPGTWVSSIGSSWRISHDIEATWASVKSIISFNRYLSAYAVNGGYNDMDMLEIGMGLTDAQERSHFGIWCIQASPLLIGCDINTLSAKSLSLLSNEELIAINQDPLGLQAYIVKANAGVYLYVKDIETLNGNKRVIAVYNSTNNNATFTLKTADVDLAGTVKVRDLFAKADLSDITTGSMTISVPMHDTKIYVLEAEERLERTVYEAETAWMERFQDLGKNNNLGHAKYIEDANCSGGAKVGWLGNHADNWMEWRNVWSKEGGIYDMEIAYGYSDGRSLYWSVNGGEQTLLNTPSNTSGGIKTVKASIVLRPGLNTIRLANPTGWAADIDKMTLKKTAPDPTDVKGISVKKGNKSMKIVSDGTLKVKSDCEATAGIWNAAGVKLRTVSLKKGENVISALPQGVCYVLIEE